MRYGQIRKYDVANGPGIRVSFFVTGCTHNCFNCFNKEYQDFQHGNIWTDEETDHILELLDNPHIRGLSVLGGEPFQNSKDLTEVLRKINQEKSPEKDIWVWSGYTYDQIIRDEEMFELLKEVDVLVDGPFVQKLKDLTLKFRGSSNQRIIDVEKTLQKGELILYDI